jgi:hypothetical protein
MNGRTVEQSVVRGAGGLGMAGWLAVSIALHAVGGAGVVLLSDEDRSEATPAESPPLLAERRVELGSPTMRIASLSWIGAPQDTGAAGERARVDQARQETPSPAALAEAGGRAAGVLRNATAPGQRAAQRAAQAARRGVENAAGMLFRAGLRGAQHDDGAKNARDNPRAQRDTPDSGEQGAASTTTGDTTAPTERADTGRGGEDDREAPATQRMLVDAQDLGEPIEAFGLRVLTRRPTFSLVTEIRARVRNPRVVVDFGGSGRVEGVHFLVRSGHRDVDADLENALWAWRAVPLAGDADNASSAPPAGERPILPTTIEFEIGLKPER